MSDGVLNFEHKNRFGEDCDGKMVSRVQEDCENHFLGCSNYRDGLCKAIVEMQNRHIHIEFVKTLDSYCKNCYVKEVFIKFKQGKQPAHIEQDCHGGCLNCDQPLVQYIDMLNPRPRTDELKPESEPEPGVCQGPRLKDSYKLRYGVFNYLHMNEKNKECDGRMVIRTKKESGDYFLGCSNYNCSIDKCNAALNLQDGNIHVQSVQTLVECEDPDCDMMKVNIKFEQATNPTPLKEEHAGCLNCDQDLVQYMQMVNRHKLQPKNEPTPEKKLD